MATKEHTQQRDQWHSDNAGKLHVAEWAAEAAGTAVLLFVIVSVVTANTFWGGLLDQRLPSTGAPLLVAGLLIAGTASLVAISPLGRLSGGHLNPAVTFGFWLTGHVHRHDLVGYVAAQVLGAFAGTGLAALVWREQAFAARLAPTHPGYGVDDSGAAVIEAMMTAILLFVIFVLNSDSRTMRITPLVAWLLVAFMVWRVSPLTGTSLNPARSLAPAVLDGDTSSLWLYLVAPLVGAAFAAGLVRIGAVRRPLTAKLFHDPSYPSVMRTMVASAEGPEGSS